MTGVFEFFFYKGNNYSSDCKSLGKLIKFLIYYIIGYKYYDV